MYVLRSLKFIYLIQNIYIPDLTKFQRYANWKLHLLVLSQRFIQTLNVSSTNIGVCGGRKEAVFTMSNIDCLLNCWRATKWSCTKFYKTTTPRNWILEILKSEKDEYLTWVYSETGMFGPRQDISQEESAGTAGLNLGLCQIVFL